MSITDELRTWMYGHTVNCSDNRIALVAIADRIDAEHEKATAGCIHYDPERHYCAVHGDTENGWVRLPLDADGVPIHVGDVVTMQLLLGGESKPLVVDRMELSHGRDGDLWCVALDTDKECWNQPSLMRHYTPPTVEDVLVDMLMAWCTDKKLADALPTDSFKEFIAEYAAKLRLAGEDE